LRFYCGIQDKQISENLEIVINNYLENLIYELIDSARLPMKNIVGIGVGLPGTVNPKSHIIKFAPLVGVSNELDLSQSISCLESNLSMPVVIENDANVAALGEYARRFKGNDTDLLFAIVGRGFGAGLILDGKLRRGPRQFTGEIGYLVFDPLWQASFTKPGWLEAQADLASFWSEVVFSGGPSEKALERVTNYLAISLSSICISLDIEQIILGGLRGMSFESELIQMIQKRISQVSVLPITCTAPLAEEPGVIGAGRLALDYWLQEIFKGP
jgi:predicted NBD/HSP70 family sugar kinase